MLNGRLNLSEKTFNEGIEKIPTRSGYGEGLVEAGKRDERVVVLCADLTESTKVEDFKKTFPERFIEMGVAEQNLVTVASGMANYGKIPFASSYAVFSPGRNWEQIRTTICINNVPVKIASTHAGVNVGADGATHQALEDIALMRVLPNMIVVVPCDAEEAKKATIEAAQNRKPTYIRLTREKSPVMTTDKTPFEIGKAETLWESKNPQVAIIGCGPLVYEALLAAKNLDEEGVGTLVINNHTIKPIDKQAIISAAKLTGAVVTVEEHQINGGLGGAVSEVLSQNYSTPIEFVGMPDSFGESGSADELLEKYDMKSKYIIDTARKVIARKSS